MPTSLEDEARGLSAPLACQAMADIVRTDNGAPPGEHHRLSIGLVTTDKSNGHRFASSSSSSSNRRRSSRPPVTPIVSVLIALALLSLILSSISLALTCVAMTTSARQRRVGAAAEGLALHKEQARQTNNDSETRQNKALVRDPAHEAHNKDAKSSVQLPLFSGEYASNRRLSGVKAPVIESVPCQCTTFSLAAVEQPPVAAHVCGSENDTNTSYNIIKWQTVSISYEIVGRDGRLVTPEDGLYTVYSQLYIILYTDEEEWKQSVALSHGVFDRRPTHEESVEKGEKLMERKWTQTWKKDSSVIEATSFLAGIFHLRSNDELTVRWSKPGKFQIHPDQKITYFGMFKIQ